MSDISINVGMNVSDAIAGVNALADEIEERASVLADLGATGAAGDAGDAAIADFQTLIDSAVSRVEALNDALASTLATAEGVGEVGAAGAAEMAATYTEATAVLDKLNASLARVTDIASSNTASDSLLSLGEGALDALDQVDALDVGLGETRDLLAIMAAEGADVGPAISSGIEEAIAQVNDLGAAVSLTRAELITLAATNPAAAGAGIAAIQAAGLSAQETDTLLQGVRRTIPLTSNKALLEQGFGAAGGTPPPPRDLLAERQAGADIQTEALDERRRRAAESRAAQDADANSPAGRTQTNFTSAENAEALRLDDDYLASLVLATEQKNLLSAAEKEALAANDDYISSVVLAAEQKNRLAAAETEALAGDEDYVASTAAAAVAREKLAAAETTALSESETYASYVAQGQVAQEQLNAAILEAANALRTQAGLPLVGVSADSADSGASEEELKASTVELATQRNLQAAQDSQSFGASSDYLDSTVRAATERNLLAAAEAEALAADEDYIASSKAAAAARKIQAEAEGGGVASGGGGGLGLGLGNIGQFAAFTAVFQGGFALFNDLKTGLADSAALTRQLGVLQTQAEAIGQGSNFGALRDNIIGVANDTGLAGTAVATLASEFLGLYQNVGEANTATTDAAQLIKVIGVSASSAGPQLGAIAQDFGVSVSQIGNTVLTLQNQTGRTGADILAGLGAIAPAAADLGLTLNQTAGLLDVVSKSSSQTGDTLGNLLGRVLPQLPGKINDLLADGIKLDPTALSGGPGAGADIISSLLDQFSGLAPALQQKLAKDLGGQRTSPLVAALLDNANGSAQFNQDFNTSGLVSKEFAASQDSLATTLDRVKTSIVSLGDALLHSGILDFFQVGLELLSPFLLLLEDLVKVAGTLNNGLGGIPATLLGIAAAAKIAEAVGGKLGIGAAGAGAAEGAAAGSAGAVTAAGAAELEAAYVAYDEAVATATSELQLAMETASETIDSSGATFAEQVAAAGAAFDEAVATAGATLEAAGGIAGGAEGLGGIGATISGVVESLAGLPPVLLAIALAAVAIKGSSALIKFDEGPQNAADKAAASLSTSQLTSQVALAFNGDTLAQAADKSQGGVSARSKFDILGPLYSAALSLLDQGGNVPGDANVGHNALIVAARQAELSQYQNDIQALQAAGLLNTSGDQKTISAALADPGSKSKYEALVKLVQSQTNSPIGAAVLANAASQQAAATAITTATNGDADDIATAQAAFAAGQISLATLFKALQLNVAAYKDNPAEAVQLAAAQKALSQQILQSSADERTAADNILSLSGGSKTAVDAADIASLVQEANNPDISPQDRATLAGQVATAAQTQLTDMAAQATSVQAAAAILEKGLSGPEAQAIRSLLLQTSIASAPGLSDALQAAATASGTSLTDIINEALATGQGVREVAIQIDQAAIDALTKTEDRLTADGALNANSINVERKILAAQAALDALEGAPDVATPGQLTGSQITTLPSQLAGAQAGTALATAQAGSDAVLIAQQQEANANADAAAAKLSGNQTLIAQAATEQVTAGQALGKALEDLSAAQSAYVAAQLQAAGNIVGADAANLRGDETALANAASQGIKKGTSAYIALQQKISQDQAQAAQDAISLYNAQTSETIAQQNQVGNSIGAAQSALAQAQHKLQVDIATVQQQGGSIQNNTTIANDLAAVTNAQANVASTIVSQSEQRIQDYLDLNEITTSQAIAELEALESVTKDQNTLLDIKTKIKQLLGGTSSNLQFDLPTDISLPTLYEARRLNQTPTGVGYTDARSIQVTLNSYGQADMGEALKTITDAIGATGNFGTQARRY